MWMGLVSSGGLSVDYPGRLSVSPVSPEDLQGHDMVVVIVMASFVYVCVQGGYVDEAMVDLELIALPPRLGPKSCPRRVPNKKK